MKRRPSHELLDSDSGSPSEIAASLRDLQMFNQWFGGVHTAEKLIRRALPVLPDTPISLLEVAAGNGYLPERVHQRISPEINLKITLLDHSRHHLNGTGPAVAADARALPFADNSFHLVSCNLFVHHLAPEDIGRFAREALRVCRTAFLINDLIRDPLHLALAYAGFPLYRSRLTRNDAPASVRQAYTPNELRDLLSSSGTARISISRHYLYRMGIIAWKQPE
ncbi:MAG: methyltransferase domain-containing protein [Terriglobales bacterium]